MNNEPKQLPVPSLTAEQVQVLVNFALEMPTKYGSEILKVIEKAAFDIEKAAQAPKVE
jgi:hypothetical protein